MVTARPQRPPDQELFDQGEPDYSQLPPAELAEHLDAVPRDDG